MAAAASSPEIPKSLIDDHGGINSVIYRACNPDNPLAEREAAAHELYALALRGPLRMHILNVYCALVALCRHVGAEEAARVVPNFEVQNPSFQRVHGTFGEELREEWIMNEPALAIAVARHAGLRGRMICGSDLLRKATLSPVGTALLANLSLREIEDAIGCPQVHARHLVAIRDASDEDVRYVFARRLATVHRSRPRPYVPEALHTKYAQRIMASPASVLATLEVATTFRVASTDKLDDCAASFVLYGLLHPDENMPRVQGPGWTAEEWTRLAIFIAKAVSLLHQHNTKDDIRWEQLPVVLGVEMTADLGLMMIIVAASLRLGLEITSMPWVVEQTVARVAAPSPFEHPDLLRLMAHLPRDIQRVLNTPIPDYDALLGVPASWGARVARAVVWAAMPCGAPGSLYRHDIKVPAARRLARCPWIPFSAVAEYDGAMNAIQSWDRDVDEDVGAISQLMREYLQTWRQDDEAFFALLRLAMRVCQTQRMREACASAPTIATLALLCLEYRAVCIVGGGGGGVVLRGIVAPLLRRRLRAQYTATRPERVDTFDDVVAPLLRVDIEWL